MIMQFGLVYVCVACVWAVGASSIGRSEDPCIAPLQWEGRRVQYDHSTGRNTRAAVAYDAQNQRVRVLEQKTGHTPCKKYVAKYHLSTLMRIFFIYYLDLLLTLAKRSS